MSGLRDSIGRRWRNRVRKQHLLTQGFVGVHVKTTLDGEALECDNCTGPGVMILDGEVWCAQCLGYPNLDQYHLAMILRHMRTLTTCLTEDNARD